MTEAVHLEILSVAGLQSAERLGALGRVLDAFPEIRPERMGPRDPPRTKVASVEAQLAAWAPSIRPGDYFNQFMARAMPRTYGLLWVTGDIWNYPPIAPHKLEFGVEEDWFDGPERTARLERVAALFLAAAESMDACWGIASLTSLRRQTNDFTARARAAQTLEWPGMPGTGWDVREHALPDIGWLNWFGPSFVETWGEAEIARLGIRSQRGVTGGYLVRSTETPFVFDAGAQRMTDYPWKRPFYDRLGWDAVLHEHWRDPGAGVRVPDYQSHRRHVAGG